MTQEEALIEIIVGRTYQLKRLVGLQVLCGLLLNLQLAAEARLAGKRVPEGLEEYAEILNREIIDRLAFNERLEAWVKEQEELEGHLDEPEEGEDDGQAAK